MSIKNLYPTIKPSLLLDFANTEELDPRITFTRTTTARYYDGKTTAKAEENLLLRSQEFQDVWSPLRVVRTANTTAAPDGTTTADSVIQESGQTVAGNVAQTISVIAGATAVSVFAKPDGKNFLILRETALDGTLKNTWFDVSTGTVGTTAAGHTATITASTNGFYRCAITFTVNAARSGSFFISLADTDNSTTVTDSGGLYLWGAQLEQRSAVTAYTPTTTQPITNYVPVLQTAAAGQARFDHNPITGESLGLLIEEQRTNLFQRSEEFDNAYWTKTESTVTSNTVVAPDGTLTGDKLVENTSSDPHRVQRTIGVTGAHTLTVYAKAAERTWIALNFANLANGLAYFNLSNGTLGTVQSGLTATITSVGNGWYRCSISATLTSTGQFPDILIATADLSIAYTGNGYSGIYLWGAQVEAGAFPTSYIPTVGSTVTRNADAASMTGTNFSSWYRADEGTIVSVGTSNSSSVDGTNLSISDGTSNNRYQFGTGASNAVWNPFVTLSGSGVATLTQSISFSPKTNQKLALAYKVNDFAATTSGATVVTDTSGTLPVVDRLLLGASGSGVVTWNSYIRKISYYPSRLSNANLQALTT